MDQKEKSGLKGIKVPLVQKVSEEMMAPGDQKVSLA